MKFIKKVLFKNKKGKSIFGKLLDLGRGALIILLDDGTILGVPKKA